ncbi:MAG: hypothetical protein RL038_210 [Actinomycetota bacterium]
MAKLRTPKWMISIRETYRLTKPVDPAIRWILPLTFLAVTGALLALGLLLGGFWISLAVTSWAWGLLAMTFVFGRRAERAAYAQIDGMPGAAAQVLGTLKAGWFTAAAVEVNRNQELVHRVVGRPGVILVVEAERGSSIVQTALTKTQRWVGEIPIHTIYVGHGEGKTPIAKLNRTVMKLPKALRPAEVTELRRKLEAVGGSALPIPKGPMPKGMRVPRR